MSTGPRLRWSRRAFVATLLTLPSLAAVATESLPMKRAKFRESGKKVKMEIELPALLKTSDRAAMDQVSAGFATRLVFDLGVFKWGERKPSAATQIVRRIYFDIFNKEYIVEQKVDGRVEWVQRRKLRDDAVKLAVRLNVRVCEAAALVRGDESIYVVRILAQRNPIEAKRHDGRHGRGHDRNQGWFADWVGAFVASPPEAEYTVEARSSAFYLLER